KKITEDMDGRFHFNTAIASLMELTNSLSDVASRKESASPQIIKMTGVALYKMLIILGPFVPHLCEEIWSNLGETSSIFKAAWPDYDERFLSQSMIEIAVQINGKVRGRLVIASDADEKTVLEQAKQNDKLRPYLQEGKIVKEIYIPGKLVNIVVKN
ncbi:MAG: class I tRNA ligase family protein, partial [Candidatus Aureabacteria bacterium]|nr:class I tRNA ligase family protein [Candidatus Auribacterota bacterium]